MLQHSTNEALNAVRDSLSSDSGSAGSNLARHSKGAFGSVPADPRVFQEHMLINSDLPVGAPESNRVATVVRSQGLCQSNAVLDTVAQAQRSEKDNCETATHGSVDSTALGIALKVGIRPSELIEMKWIVPGTVHTARWTLRRLVQHIETFAAAYCRDRDGESAAETVGLTWTRLSKQLRVLLSPRLERHEQRCSFLQRARSKAVAGKLLLGRSLSSARLPRWYRLTSRGFLLPSGSSWTTAGGPR